MNSSAPQTLLLIIPLLCAWLTPAWSASFQGLGHLGIVGPGSLSRAFAVSGDGNIIVGEAKTNGSSDFEAFRWTSATGLVGLGDLPGGDFESHAGGISADGNTIVGRSVSSNSAPGDGLEAFRWTEATGMVGLGDLPGGRFHSLATGVSGDGSVIVGTSDPTNGTEAFRWTEAQGMVGLGGLPGRSGIDPRSDAHAISEDGNTIVGSGLLSSGKREAFRWTFGSGMVSLGNLAGTLQSPDSAFALAVSSNGSVIAGLFSPGTAGAPGTEAFRWTAAGGMVGLGDLPGGLFESRALGISPDGGIIVGQGNSSNRGEEAFIWDSTNGMRSLQTLLETEMSLSSELAGWTLLNANGISADGRTIVGDGRNPSGNIEAWMAHLDPPNTAPTVDAGLPQTITLPSMAAFNGTVSDDGFPSTPGMVTTTWSKVSGPGTVTFGDPNVVDTTATFSLPGTYVLRLTADDGALSASDEVTITVNPAPPTNQAPSVNAGTAQTVTLPGTATLNGTVSDDGLPASPGTVTTIWSKVSGPGKVTFGNATAMDTTATFNHAGIYVLRLTANDGLLQAFDDLSITVTTKGGPTLYDLNADGTADLVWRHTSNGVVAVWLLNGTTMSAAGFVGGVPFSWKIEGIGDVSGDNKADVIWRNTTSGTVAIWFMNGANIGFAAFVAGVPLAWELDGVGDVSGDGKADLVWRNTTSGQMAIWLMNNGTITSSAFWVGLPLDWEIAGMGDLNGDEKADVIWRNKNTGALQVWLMNGLTISSGGFPGSTSTDWKIKGVGDVDGDGKSDLVWRNETSHVVAIWLMNGTTMASTAFLGGVPQAWKIEQVADVNGDGKADVIWQHSSGTVAVWLMNGPVIESVGFPGNAPPVWEIQP